LASHVTSSVAIVVKYLEEAKAMEAGLGAMLAAQIAATPAGRYRTRLERHLRETRRHAARLEARLDELGAGPGPLARGRELAEAVVGRTIAVGRLPIELLRGMSGEEAVLRRAKEACATAALEVAAYRAVEQIAVEIQDTDTARMAREIRLEEEELLADLLDLVAELATEVVDVEVIDHGTYDPEVIERVGAADGAGVLPIRRYDERGVDEITERLTSLSQEELARVELYERRNRGRVTVLARIASLRASEPWPGYDELTVAEVQARMPTLDAERRSEVRAYERRHKNRRGVIAASERDVTTAS
jgi:ferritin-like metal-binding protein YciE